LNERPLVVGGGAVVASGLLPEHANTANAIIELAAVKRSERRGGIERDMEIV
jgi:hypothetical protein